jgi:uncharacterized protein YqfA (UPF0365 family)
LADPDDPPSEAAVTPAAKTLAKYRAHMIAREEEFRQVEEERRAALVEAQARADHSLALLHAERDLRLEAEATLAAIKASRSWRAANRIRALLTGPRALARLFGLGR